MAFQPKTEELVRWRTAIVPVRLSGQAYRAAHEACHTAALLWDMAVDWVHGEWKEGRSPGKAEIRAYLTSLPKEQRPLHAHTVEEVAYDLHDAIETSRTNRKAGMKVRAPWRKKNYRPLSFTAGYGWRVKGKKLKLSLGLKDHHLSRINLDLPEVADPATGQAVPYSEWGEVRLCWDQDARQWSLHIAVPTVPAPVLDPSKVVAIDEGIINPMALATRTEDGFDVLVINGREVRAIKRERNKAVGSISRLLSRTKQGSKRHRHLVASKKKVKARANARLYDFNHQVAHKAASFVQDHGCGRVVVGDVRGIERNTEKKRRARRSTRQQLSQWERGEQEGLLSHKLGATLEHINEAFTSRTCPACLEHNRPRGRDYRCKHCGFSCHRDAVGAINILVLATHDGVFTPIGPGCQIRVTYLRAVPRWSPGQRRAQSAKSARARSKAENPAPVALGRPLSSATSQEAGPKAVAA